MKKLLKPFDYLFVLMPVHFFVVWAVFLAGFFVQSEFGVAATEAMSNHATVEGSRTFLGIGVALTLLMGAIFVVHQIMDRNSEDKKQDFFLITKGEITPKAALIESALFIAVSLGLGFFLSAEIGLIFIALLLMAGFLYNFQPFSWKDKPVWSLATNLGAAFLIFTTGWVIRGDFTFALLLHAVPYLSMITAIYLFATIPEKKESVEEISAASRIRLYVGLSFQVLALIVAYFLNDEVIFYPALFALPFYIWSAVYPAHAEILRAVKYSIMLLILTICVKWIVVYSNYVLFFIVAGVYFGSKIYYRLRLGINYPSLSV